MLTEKVTCGCGATAVFRPLALPALTGWARWQVRVVVATTMCESWKPAMFSMTAALRWSVNRSWPSSSPGKARSPLR